MSPLEKLGWMLAATAVTAAAAGLGIAALVLPDAPPDDSQATSSAAPSCADCTSEEATYLAEVRKKARQAGNATDDALINVGWGLCDAIAANGHLTGAETLDEKQVSAYDTRVLIDAATANLCPEFRPNVTDYVSPSPSHA